MMFCDQALIVLSGSLKRTAYLGKFAACRSFLSDVTALCSVRAPM
jgi:hypothetical protein